MIQFYCLHGIFESQLMVKDGLTCVIRSCAGVTSPCWESGILVKCIVVAVALSSFFLKKADCTKLDYSAASVMEE